MPALPQHAPRLLEAIRAVVPAVERVAIGIAGDSSTVTVEPANQQAAAQATINAFDWAQATDDLFAQRKNTRQIGRSTAVRLTADRATTSTGYGDVTGLSFDLDANAHYAFTFNGAYDAAAATTGCQLALNGPANSFLAVAFEMFTATNAVLAAVAAAYDTGINPTGSGGATLLPFRIFGNLTTTAAGLLVVRFRSEVNASQVRIRRGSYGLLFGVG